MLKKWMLSGNPNITYLVKIHLFDELSKQNNDGYIKRYLDLYSEEEKMWGDGLYSPKWVSSTYTLLDLVNLSVEKDQRMLDAYNVLRSNIAIKYTLNPKDKRTLDLCIAGMLIKIGSYLEVDIESHKEVIDYILYTINDDGAWNCYYNYREYKTSSLHTTINILEGLVLYIDRYDYRVDEVRKVIKSANEFILKKKLFRSRRTNEIINNNFIQIHYPTRWRYDYIRAMEYFASIEFPYDVRMEESIDRIKEKIKKGYISKGKTYTGRVHFNMELEDYKRINTYRVLKILKVYDYDTFKVYTI